MKDRVLETLKALRDGTDARLTSDYEESTGLESSVIEKKSAAIFNQIIHRYGEFAILTIDKFIHRIIRSFTRELDLGMTFEVESDVDSYIERSIGLLLDKAGDSGESQLTNYLIDYTEKLVDDDATGDIEKGLVNLSPAMKDDQGREALQSFEKFKLEDFESIRQGVYDNLDSATLALNESLDKMAVVLKEIGWSEDDFSGRKTAGWNRFFADWRGNGVKDLELKQGAINQFENEKWYKKTDRITEDEIGVVNANMEGIIACYKEFAFYREMTNSISAFSLLSFINSILNDVKTNSNVIFINDFNALINQIIRKEPAPFIYEKIGARYQNFLIDEFQDTSDLQWTNLVPLVHNSLSEGNPNLIVGDAKQAIYRWRGGDARQFVALPKVEADFDYLNEINSVLGNAGEVNHLGNNYRSAKSIIEFNNTMFRTMADNGGASMTEIYGELEQNCIRKETGLVHYQVYESGDKVEAEEEAIEFALYAVKQAIEDGYKPGDIAILTKVKKDGAKVAFGLSNEGYNVTSVDSIVLGSSSKINFIEALLQSTLTEDHIHSKYVCLSYLAGEENSSLVYDKWRVPVEGKPQFTADIDLDGFLAFNYPKFNWQALHGYNLYDKILAIIDGFGLGRHDPYIDQLLATTQNYMISEGSSVRGFVHFLSDRKSKIPVNLSSDSGSINILTIHKSKGLQFPVVIIPKANWKNDNNTKVKLTWLKHQKFEQLGLPNYISKLSEGSLSKYQLKHINDKEKEQVKLDNLNLLYVAFTRPEDRLYIGCRQPEKNANDITQLFRKEVQEMEGYDESKRALIIGEREIFKHSKASPDQELIKGVNPGEWRSKLTLSLRRNGVTDDETIAPRLKGIIVHRVLAELKSLDNLDDVIELIGKEFCLSDDLIQEVKEVVSNLYNNEEIAHLLSRTDRVLNERDILTEGEIHRPDRVVITEEECLVIDFKTGKPNPKDHQQLEEYASLLKQMGYDRVEKYLLYTDQIKLEHV